MSAKKKAKKRLPKPVPCECWAVAEKDGRVVPDWCTGLRSMARNFAANKDGARVIRVRITPVAKRRKGATR